MRTFFRKLFGIKRSRTLSDFDNLSLKDINESFRSNEFNNSYTFGMKPEGKLCKKCGSEMIKFIPEIVLGNKNLHQCSKCSWREYL